MGLARVFFGSVILWLFICMPAVGEPSLKTKATFGAWAFKCTEKNSVQGFCVASQLVVAGEPKQTILGVTVGLDKGHPMPHIILRFSSKANQEKGTAMKVDEQEPFHVPISNCDINICEVRSFIPESLLSQMLSGSLLQFAFYIDKKQMLYPVSLTGLDSIYKKLQRTP